jgi:hypothetical protein
VLAYFDTDDLWNPNSAYNDTNFNASLVYKPTPFVEAFHLCPHIGSRGQLVEDPQFVNVPSEDIMSKRGKKVDPEDQAEVDEYRNSLLAFPIMLGAIGIIGLVFLDLGIAGYLDWLVPPLGPKELDEDEQLIAAIALNVHANEISRKNWLTYFVVSISVALLGTNLMFYGNFKFDVGYEAFKESIDGIGRDLFTIGVGVTSLFDDLSLCSSEIQTAIDGTCPQAADVPARIEVLEHQLTQFNSQMIIMADYVNDVNREIESQVKQKDAYLFSIYALSMAMLLVFGIIAFFRNTLYMKYTVYAAQFAIVVLLAQGTFEFILMMYFSDFCMDPLNSVWRSMEGLGIIQQTAKYYGFCEGLNPIHRSLAESYLVRDDVGNRLVSLFDYNTNPACECRSDRTVIDSFRHLQAMHDEYEHLAVLMDCHSVRNTWVKIYDMALCKNTLAGLMILWVTGWFTVFALFVTATAASVLMLYFDKHWEEVTDGADLVEQIRLRQGQAGKVTTESSASDSDSDANA